MDPLPGVQVIGASLAVFDQVGGAGASWESGFRERERVVGDGRELEALGVGATAERRGLIRDPHRVIGLKRRIGDILKASPELEVSRHLFVDGDGAEARDADLALEVGADGPTDQWPLSQSRKEPERQAGHARGGYGLDVVGH